MKTSISKTKITGKTSTLFRLISWVLFLDENGTGDSKKANIKHICKQFCLLILCFSLKNSIAQAPVANFSYNVGAGGNLSFIDLSITTGTNVSYQWNFGDYSNSSSNVMNPGFTYTCNGSYIVAMTVSDSNGVDTISKTVVITNTTCAAYGNINLFNQGGGVWNASVWYPGNVAAATWMWGDSSPNTNGLTPSHTYSAQGTYSICVSFTVACGASTTICKSQYIFKGRETELSLVASLICLDWYSIIKLSILFR